MSKIIYIGNNKIISSRISLFLSKKIYEFSSINNFIDSFKGDKKCLYIVFYQKNTLSSDFNWINYLKYSLQNSYLILVANALDDSHAKSYLNAGISDTLVGDFTKERLIAGIDFIENNILTKNIISNINVSEKVFRLPRWKRVFDILFSTCALLVLSPLLVIIAILIYLEDNGPVIYKSKRVGSNYNIFDFLKFRSMYIDADKRLKEFDSLNQYSNNDADTSQDLDGIKLFDDNLDINQLHDVLISDDFIIDENLFNEQKNTIQENAFVKLENDPRVTKVGKFIRKFSIDELPQLFNILKGDMSVVGNRPLPLYEAELLTSDEYIDRFFAPSGLTGLWQVEKRGSSGKLSPQERKMLDIKYAKTFSPIGDIIIILRTFTAFIQKENV